MMRGSRATVNTAAAAARCAPPLLVLAPTTPHARNRQYSTHVLQHRRTNISVLPRIKPLRTATAAATAANRTASSSSSAPRLWGALLFLFPRAMSDFASHLHMQNLYTPNTTTTTTLKKKTMTAPAS
jgi:hypothetical protein